MPRPLVALATLLLSLIFAIVLAAPAAAAPDPAVTVPLTGNGGSGVTGSLTFRGTAVTGTATGFNPASRYITLTYGDLSTAQTGQATTCADPRTALSPRQWAVTPEWNVNPDGSGTLTGTLARQLGDVYTASIRQVPATALPDPLVGFNPVTYPVRACGAVAPADGDGLGVVGGPLGTVPNVLPPVPALPLPL